VPTEYEAYSVSTVMPRYDGTYDLPQVLPGIELGLYYQKTNKDHSVRLTTFTGEEGKDLDLGDTPIPQPDNP